MGRSKKKLRIGILGCGAIGSRIARSINKELKGICSLGGFFDSERQKMERLAATLSVPKKFIKKSLEDLIKNCDLMVESVNAPRTDAFIRQALSANRHVLAMSVGKLLGKENLFSLAARQGCSLLIPSGAIAGIDALKAASLGHIDKIILTTRKPLSGFGPNPFFEKNKIDLSRITQETMIFNGDVSSAVKFFPQNINVAATLALAGRHQEKLTVRIVTSPDFVTNSHEVEVTGDFGRMVSRTDNVPCHDNPKTSLLAVLSAIQTLKDFCSGNRIGT